MPIGVRLATFESFVNSDRCKAKKWRGWNNCGLRALLIQIGIKHIPCRISFKTGLRALLIQIGIKLRQSEWLAMRCLRALLIQIGIKLT